MRVRVAFGALLALLATSPGRAGQSAVEMVKDSGIRGGGVVHVDCGDGKLTASLRVDDSLVVQGLDRDPANVERARQHFHSLGLGGHLTASIFDGRRLPYADTLVNLLFVSDPSAISREEVLRVLCPGGAAYVESKAGEDWKTTVKPWPQEMDQWTHFLYGPRSSHGRGGQDARRCRRIHPGSPSSLLSQQGDRAVHHHGTDGNRVRQSRRRPQADGKVFVADVERHTLYALDLATGEEVWSHVAGGRVDSPPTYWRGRVYFGPGGGLGRSGGAPSGRLWAYDDQNVYGYGEANCTRHHLFCTKKDRAKPSSLAPTVAGRQQRRGAAMPAAVWSDTHFPIMVRALVLARASRAEQEPSGRLVVAGPPAAAVTNLEVLRGEAGGLLAVVDAATGQSVSQLLIESTPVFDGMCVARGHVVMSLSSGTIAAFK